MGTNRAKAVDDTPCPFYARPTHTCFAVVGGGSLREPQWATRCDSVDHDEYPTFLGRSLRSLKAHPFL